MCGSFLLCEGDMATWNQFSEEVREERRLVRAYGLDKVQDRVREPDSYKGQALRQLAMRLELEEEVRALKAEVAELVDKLDAIEGMKDSVRSTNTVSAT